MFKKKSFQDITDYYLFILVYLLLSFFLNVVRLAVLNNIVDFTVAKNICLLYPYVITYLPYNLPRSSVMRDGNIIEAEIFYTKLISPASGDG